MSLHSCKEACHTLNVLGCPTAFRASRVHFIDCAALLSSQQLSGCREFFCLHQYCLAVSFPGAKHSVPFAATVLLLTSYLFCCRNPKKSDKLWQTVSRNATTTLTRLKPLARPWLTSSPVTSVLRRRLTPRPWPLLWLQADVTP